MDVNKYKLWDSDSDGDAPVEVSNKSPPTKRAKISSTAPPPTTGRNEPPRSAISSRRPRRESSSAGPLTSGPVEVWHPKFKARDRDVTTRDSALENPAIAASLFFSSHLPRDQAYGDSGTVASHRASIYTGWEKLNLDIGYVLCGLTSTVENLEIVKQEIHGPDGWKAKYAMLEKERDELRIKAVKIHKELQVAEDKHRDYVAGVNFKMESLKETERLATQAAVDKAVKEAADRFRSLAAKKIARELQQQLDQLSAAGRLLPAPTPVTDTPPLVSPTVHPEAAETPTPDVTTPMTSADPSPVETNENASMAVGENENTSLEEPTTNPQQ